MTALRKIIVWTAKNAEGVYKGSEGFEVARIGRIYMVRQHGIDIRRTMTLKAAKKQAQVLLDSGKW